MRVGIKRSVFVTAACLLWLTGCETTSTKLPDIFGANGAKEEAGNAANLDATGSIPAPSPPPESQSPFPQLTPSDPNDDLSIGKQNFRQGNYGLAEHYFRRAAETGPKDAEAWLGLAASYDRLRRFDLADRAYGQLIKILGPTPEVLNNQGYSYMLRGEYARAREILTAAQAKDPANPYIQNNLALLAETVRSRKAVR